ncbi:hypothetical protein VG1_CDS0021 [Arthrobacter phage Cupello]|nr:hypothetical protein VG1_CDS0021 [Arthrobacter phage Cupello]
MPTTTKNGAAVPVGSDPYALTADLLKMMESAGLVYPVPDQATMLAIPSPNTGMVVLRRDVGTYMHYDGTEWVDTGIGQEFSRVVESDANWTYKGGLYRDRSALLESGDKRVHLSLLLTRTGASVNNIGTAYVQAFAGIIPAGFRPDGYAATCYSILNNAAGGDAWGMYVRVDKNGDLAFRADTGTTNLLTGYMLPVNMSWQVA